MSNALDITDESFEQDVKKSEIPVLVDFWAPWCGPCRMQAPIIDELSKEFTGRVKFVKINVDENQKQSNDYSVSGIPSLMLFINGEVVDRLTGLQQKSQLKSIIESYL